MDRVIDFIAMGGYGAYVWGAYGLSAVALLLTWWLSRRRERILSQLLADSRDQGEER